MFQGYALCVLDYEFQILDNAFLVHRPGIKKFKQDRTRAIISSKTQSIIKRYSYPELKVFYGVRTGCIVWRLPSVRTSVLDERKRVVKI